MRCFYLLIVIDAFIQQRNMRWSHNKPFYYIPSDSSNNNTPKSLKVLISIEIIFVKFLMACHHASYLPLETRRSSDFCSLLERISDLNQPWLVALEPTKAYRKGDSLPVVPRRHGDARIAPDGENRGGVAVGRHDCIQLVFLHQLFQPIGGYLLEPLDGSSLPGANAIGFLRGNQVWLPKIFESLLQHQHNRK